MSVNSHTSTSDGTSQTGPQTGGDEYDVVVLGAGSGGYACALRSAQLGMRVALVESDKVGGTCLHWGCIPTKAMLHAAEVADAATEGSRVGIRLQSDGVDLPAVHAFKDAVVNRLFRGLTGLITGAGITVVEGTGRLTGPNTVTVTTAGTKTPATTPEARSLTGRYVVLATGSVPRTLPQVPIGGPVMTSDELLRLERIPQRVVVLGGGVIGVEFASVLTSFGARVTIVEALPRLVPGEDEAISKALDRAFRKRGMTIRTGARVTGVEPAGDAVRIHLAEGEPVEADLLLVAVGRGPRTEGLGYAEHGVQLDRGFVVTDSWSPTNAAAPPYPGCTPWAISCRGCNWPTEDSRRESSWPRTSRGSNRSPCKNDRSHGSPTATPRSPPSGSVRRRLASNTPMSSPTSTTSGAMVGA